MPPMNDNSVGVARRDRVSLLESTRAWLGARILKSLVPWVEPVFIRMSELEDRLRVFRRPQIEAVGGEDDVAGIGHLFGDDGLAPTVNSIPGTRSPPARTRSPTVFSSPWLWCMSRSNTSNSGCPRPNKPTV